MNIGLNTSSYLYHYNSLSVEQKSQVNMIASSLGISIEELSFYFGMISFNLGNISFFAFVFLIYQKPQILNNLRMIYANMQAQANFNIGFIGGFNNTPQPYPLPSNPELPTPLPSNPGESNCVKSQIGDAFLTAFSPQDLAKLQNGEKIDLKNGIISSINNLKEFDKNNDGKLTGDELKDLQVAVDKNKDGQIEKGELAKALEAGVKEIDINSGKVTTNDGKEFNINQGNVNVGKDGKTDNKPAITIDTDKNAGQSKDGNNRLEPAPSPQLGNSPNSTNNSNGSNSGSSSSNGSSSSGNSSSSSSGSGGK